MCFPFILGPFSCIRGASSLFHTFFSASERVTSVLGQKWLRSPTGKLIPRRISAAMMTKVIYQPRIATMKSSAPPACVHPSQSAEPVNST